MSNSFLETTVPSDYDTSQEWSLTIGNYESEVMAHAIISYLQEHGDKWEPVPIEMLNLPWRIASELNEIAVTEEWLKRLQKVRCPRFGPPAIVTDAGVPQLKWPNGRRAALIHFPEICNVIHKI